MSKLHNFENKFIPCDCEDMTTLHLVDGGGCCAQACIAVILQSSIEHVFERWRHHGLDWKGYTPIKQFREFMSKEGYDVKQITKKRRTDFSAPFYFIRIQWIGDGVRKEKPYYGWKSWFDASANTHFVVMEGKYSFFCNGTGWFNSMDVYLEENEPKGVITSMFEVRKRDISKDELMPSD